MTFNYLQVCVLISTFVSTLDPFEAETWISLPASDRGTAIEDGAARLADKITAQIWEATFCAAPAINDVMVKVDAGCITHTADYSNAIIPKGDTSFSDWSPALHDLVAEKSREVKADLTDMLTDLAAAHFDGTASEGGGRYVIRVRD